MRILLTGASGFVSSYWLRHLPTQYDVFALGRRLPEGLETSRVTLLPCDLADPEGLSQLRIGGGLPEKIDAVMHMAVSRLHREFPDSAIDLFNVNCLALQQLLQYAVDAGASQFVLGSTCSVYHGLPTDKPIEESVIPNPSYYWPTSKYAADMIALQYRDLFPVSVLRFATPYGPGQYDRLIPDIIGRISRGDAVTLPAQGDGLLMRPIYVSDAANILNRTLEENWTGVTNIAGPEIVSLKALALTIGDIVGKAPIFERNPSAASHGIIPDINRLESFLDASHSFVVLREGLIQTIG